MEYAAIVLAAVWFLVTLLVLINLAWLPDLPFLTPARGESLRRPSSSAEVADLPRVSVIIAARDEQGRIRETLDRLFAQQGVDLDVIVVDDRSTDETPKILAAARQVYPRLSILRVNELPTGWLGKCHACCLAASHAVGDWLLFTDADVHMKPDLIARAVAAGEREGADHVTLWPGLNCKDALTRGAMLAFQQMFALYAPVWLINRDRGWRGLGVGAFNLVRRTAYHAIGGHQPLKLEVLDDIKLGILLRRGGFRQRVFSGLTELEADWAHGATGIIRAMEKNWFAAVNFNSFQAAALIIAFAAVTLGPATAPWWAPAYGRWALGGLLSCIVPGVVQCRRSHWPARAALFAPLGYVIFALTGLYSTVQALRRGGIKWRDTFYPLAELRQGLVR
jgi:cellulose synthase/poly-beta-1,6-N-acetylglucosamine synthase-like glycosyltransferase